METDWRKETRLKVSNYRRKGEKTAADGQLGRASSQTGFSVRNDLKECSKRRRRRKIVGGGGRRAKHQKKGVKGRLRPKKKKRIAKQPKGRVGRWRPIEDNGKDFFANTEGGKRNWKTRGRERQPNCLTNF